MNGKQVMPNPGNAPVMSSLVDARTVNAFWTGPDRTHAELDHAATTERVAQNQERINSLNVAENSQEGHLSDSVRQNAEDLSPHSNDDSSPHSNDDCSPHPKRRRRFQSVRSCCKALVKFWIMWRLLFAFTLVQVGIYFYWMSLEGGSKDEVMKNVGKLMVRFTFALLFWYIGLAIIIASVLRACGRRIYEMGLFSRIRNRNRNRSANSNSAATTPSTDAAEEAPDLVAEPKFQASQSRPKTETRRREKFFSIFKTLLPFVVLIIVVVEFTIVFALQDYGSSYHAHGKLNMLGMVGFLSPLLVLTLPLILVTRWWIRPLLVLVYVSVIAVHLLVILPPNYDRWPESGFEDDFALRFQLPDSQCAVRKTIPWFTAMQFFNNILHFVFSKESCQVPSVKRARELDLDFYKEDNRVLTLKLRRPSTSGRVDVDAKDVSDDWAVMLAEPSHTKRIDILLQSFHGLQKRLIEQFLQAEFPELMEDTCEVSIFSSRPSFLDGHAHKSGGETRRRVSVGRILDGILEWNGAIRADSLPELIELRARATESGVPGNWASAGETMQQQETFEIGTRRIIDKAFSSKLFLYLPPQRTLSVADQQIVSGTADPMERFLVHQIALARTWLHQLDGTSSAEVRLGFPVTATTVFSKAGCAGEKRYFTSPVYARGTQNNQPLYLPVILLVVDTVSRAESVRLMPKTYEILKKLKKHRSDELSILSYLRHHTTGFATTQNVYGMFFGSRPYILPQCPAFWQHASFPNSASASGIITDDTNVKAFISGQLNVTADLKPYMHTEMDALFDRRFSEGRVAYDQTKKHPIPTSHSEEEEQLFPAGWPEPQGSVWGSGVSEITSIWSEPDLWPDGLSEGVHADPYDITGGGPYSLAIRCLGDKFSHRYQLDMVPRFNAKLHYREDSAGANSVETTESTRANGQLDPLTDIYHPTIDADPLSIPPVSVFWFLEAHEPTKTVIDTLDPDIASTIQDLIDSGTLNHTALFVMSDHGNHLGFYHNTFENGWVEMSNPMLIASIPKWWLRKVEEETKPSTSLIETLEKNQQHFTTHFDFYETVVDIIRLGSKTENDLDPSYWTAPTGWEKFKDRFQTPGKGTTRRLRQVSVLNTTRRLRQRNNKTSSAERRLSPRRSQRYCSEFGTSLFEDVGYRSMMEMRLKSTCVCEECDVYRNYQK